MRSQHEAGSRRWLPVLMLSLSALGWAGASDALAQAPPAASPSAPAPAASGTWVTLTQARAAASAVAADPLMGGERTHRTLKWIDDEDEKKKKKDDPAAWLKDLADWLAGTGHFLAWLGFALALALLAVMGWRLWGRQPVSTPVETLPTHVGQLDIRPDSLPEPVGAAAAALWRGGEGRAALALLYRGALSRLVHRHRVRVRSASTEHECLQLARPLLGADAHAFLGLLIDAWLRCGYAHMLPSNDTMAVLCRRFDAQLGPAGTEAAAGPAAPGSTA